LGIVRVSGCWDASTATCQGLGVPTTRL
jgi:hypothetical protein